VKAEFDNAIIKIWFNSLSTSRNFINVTEIIQSDNMALIKTRDGKQHLVNMGNVNLIEEIDKNAISSPVRDGKK
jgi:hypothetical protein